MTGNELVAFARGKIGTPYVYGMKGKVLTQKTYDRLRILFGPLVWESDAAKIGQVCVDCSGLISWGTGILRNSQGYHDTADAVFPIATIGQAPIGAAVWRKGHIGIYIVPFPCCRPLSLKYPQYLWSSGMLRRPCG